MANVELSNLYATLPFGMQIFEQEILYVILWKILSLILAGILKYMVKTMKQYMWIEQCCGYSIEYKK